jgi:hypothetical protein
MFVSRRERFRFWRNKVRWQVKRSYRRFSDKVFLMWLSITGKRRSLPLLDQFKVGDLMPRRKKMEDVVGEGVVEEVAAPVEAACVDHSKEIRAVREEVMGMFSAYERSALEGFVVLMKHYGKADAVALEEATSKHRVLLEDLRRRYVANTNRVLEKHFGRK